MYKLNKNFCILKVDNQEKQLPNSIYMRRTKQQNTVSVIAYIVRAPALVTQESLLLKILEHGITVKIR